VGPRRLDSETFVNASSELSAGPSLRGARLPGAVWPPTNATDSSEADAAISGQCAISDRSIARECPELSARRPRPSSSATEVLRVVVLVLTPFACMFPNTDVAIASIKLSTAVGSARSHAALTAAAGVYVRPKVPLAIEVSSTGAPERLGDMPNVTEEEAMAPQPELHLAKMTTAPEIDGRNSGAAPKLSAVKTSELGQAQPGVWTYCVVNLIPTGQIAVQKAMSYQSCVSIGKKCAGARHYASIQYFDLLTWVSSAPLDVCYAES
jgi:hypothetical protein